MTSVSDLLPFFLCSCCPSDALPLSCSPRWPGTVPSSVGISLALSRLFCHQMVCKDQEKNGKMLADGAAFQYIFRKKADTMSQK